MKKHTINWALIGIGIIIPAVGFWMDRTFIHLNNPVLWVWFFYMAMLLIRIQNSEA